MTKHTSESELQALEKLANAATPGPWTGDRGKIESDEYLIADSGDWGGIILDEDAAFIAAARTAVPALIARVRELEAEVRWLDGRSR